MGAALPPPPFDFDYHHFIARFWQAFGSTSGGLLITEDCVVEARQRGYYDNVLRNKNNFKNNPAFLDLTLQCCRDAGAAAAAAAVYAGHTQIERDDFVGAIHPLEQRILELVRSGRLMLGGVCH